MKTVQLLFAVAALLWMAAGLGSAPARAASRSPMPLLPAQQGVGSGSLTLDGDGDYIAIPHAPEFVPSGGITIEAWVRRADGNRCETVVGKNFMSGIWLGFCTQKIRFYTHGSGTRRDGNSTVPVGQWTHIAVTFDGTTRRYYINGYLDYEEETPGSLPFNTDELRIGSDVSWSGAGVDFQGNIAEVRIWDYARAQWEIRRDMHRKITEPMEGLVAVWHLQENAEEGFGRYTADLRGNADFGGPPPPVYDHDPILIPRLSATPTVDGRCSPGEYNSAFWFTVWNDDPREYYNGLRPIMYLGATATDIYACVVDVPRESTPQGLYFNRNNQGGETADGDDYRILIRTDTGAVTIQRGDGAGGYVDAPLNAEAKRGQGVEFGPWVVEYRIRRSEVTSPDGRFRLQFLRRFSLLNIWYDIGWPDNAHPTRPDAWPVFMVNDANVPPSDSRPPRVRLTLSPGEEISRGTSLDIQAWADDDVDLESITIRYPGGEKTCTYSGTDDRLASCARTLSTGDLSLGWHSASATAVDHRGARWTVYTTFFVRAGTSDGQPPRVSVRYQYQNGTMYDDEDDEFPDRHDITFFATASDPDGIRRVDIEVRFDAPLPGSGRQELRLLCYGSGGEVRTEISCQNREIINIGIVGSSQFVVARYRAIAEDMSGERKETPWQYLVLTERLPDHDNDDLPTAVERRIGTDPGNPDTDRDTLIDGLEVLGMTPAGYVELPSLGADPRRKDVFVQIDYETGLGYSQADLDYFRNNLRRRGITLHVEQNERSPQTPGGVASCAAGDSTVDAVQAAALRDDRGNYYFPPARNWTHIYVYVRWLNGNSGYVGLGAEGYVNVDACAPWGQRSSLDMRYRLIHEVGHALMLGHGGWNTDPPETRRPHKYLIEYRGGWNPQNWKPNYRSIMNWLYSSDANPVIDPVNRNMQVEYDYTWTVLPNLDESNLDERASSAFATALQALPAPPGYVPAIKYRCVDPDEVDSKGPFRYEVWSDGTRMLARQRLPRDNTETRGPIQWINLPAQDQPGIDWDCDGTIESSVSLDLSSPWWNEGEQEGIRTLQVLADYNFVPGGYRCNVPRSNQPAGYQDAIRGIRCPGGRAAGATVGVQPQQETPYPHEDPEFVSLPPNTELCDGRDNDGDGQADEGCPDTDKDEVPDAIDNCPQTPDATQADRDGDGIGDICQYPSIDKLWVDKLTDTEVTLAWAGTDRDVGGYRIYRRRFDEPNFRYLATVTGAVKYTDPLPDRSIYFYEVSVLNLNGVETDRAGVATGTVRHVYIPWVVK